MIHRVISKLALLSSLATVIILATPGLAFAHVVVTPNETLTGTYETFSTSVPNEKDIPVVGLRLIIPDTVDSVTPTVKPGWEIQTKKAGDKITEITWTGGAITPELRDVFTFSAHMPAKTGDIDWKAYQIYQDGSTMSWDQKPTDDEHESENTGPYSVTTVNDHVDQTVKAQNNASSTVPYAISIIAMALSVLALVRTTRK